MMSAGQSTAVASSKTTICGACEPRDAEHGSRESQVPETFRNSWEVLEQLVDVGGEHVEPGALANAMSAAASTASRLSSASSNCAAMSPGCWWLPSASTVSYPLHMSNRWCPSTSWAWSNPNLVDQDQGLTGFRSIDASYINSSCD